MEEKKRALEIANKFVSKSVFDMDDTELKSERINAKINAIKCVDTIIEILRLVVDKDRVEYHTNYWEKVKGEIDALP
jgi:DNA primase catalytic subunit